MVYQRWLVDGKDALEEPPAYIFTWWQYFRTAKVCNAKPWEMANQPFHPLWHEWALFFEIAHDKAQIALQERAQ